MNSQEQILKFISRREKPFSKLEIVNGLGMNRNTVGWCLNQLVSSGHVDRIGHGTYKITPKGVTGVEEINADEIISLSKPAMLHTEDVTLDTNITDELIKIVMRMKKNLGREETIKKLENMKQLIE